MSRDVAMTMQRAARALARPGPIGDGTPIRVGVDLGTAFTVLVVTGEDGEPLAAASRSADVVRDGIVWDFAGATAVVRELKDTLENATGRQLGNGAVTVPPGTSPADHRAHRYVLEGAGLDCDEVVDEPTAANAVLGVTDGAVVDIGGGTTGVAILHDGHVVTTLDEPSGGTHLSLVIAGARKISFAQAEKLKVDPARQEELLAVVRPTLEKISTIVRDAIAGQGVEQIHLVGGTSAFTGLAGIMSAITGVATMVAPEPMLVTPLGVASWARPVTAKGAW